MELGESLDYDDFAENAPEANNFDEEMLGETISNKFGQQGKLKTLIH